jgi:hypothetical protein
MIQTNGGLANFSANNSNLCDAGAKENVTVSPDYTAFVEKLSFRNFSYVGMPQSGTTDDVIAQELAAIAPELVVEMPDMGGKGVLTHRLQQRINSVIPRLIARIGELEARLAVLEGKPA